MTTLPRKRFKLTLAYRGTAYNGWQIQPNAQTIQGVVTKALESFLNEPITLVGSSRTDSGVHAADQVAHFDSTTLLDPFRMQTALAAHLPKDISVVELVQAPDGFHSQNSATHKHYAYFFYLSAVPYVFFDPWAWRVNSAISIEAMQDTAPALLGTHDFSAFCASDSTAKTFTRTITSIDIHPVDTRDHLGNDRSPPLYRIDVAGPGFLKFMVRNIVGTLVEIGLGLKDGRDLTRILTSGDRTQAGRTAPAHGLILKRIVYHD